MATTEPCTLHTGHPLRAVPARWTWGAVRMRGRMLFPARLLWWTPEPDKEP